MQIIGWVRKLLQLGLQLNDAALIFNRLYFNELHVHENAPSYITNYLGIVTLFPVL